MYRCIRWSAHAAPARVLLAAAVLMAASWHGERARAQQQAAPKPHPAEVSVSGVEGYWTGLGAVGVPDMSNSLGRNGLYVIHGTVRNDSSAPIRFVRLRFELLADDGKAVATQEGFNRAAESMLDSRRFGGELDDSRIRTVAIPPGATDTFRTAFVAEETPRFRTHRVSVVGVE